MVTGRGLIFRAERITAGWDGGVYILLIFSLPVPEIRIAHSHLREAVMAQDSL